ncbi:MAG: tRNA (pseudouridine(54)-N(1))-methyltransferase TrmY [Candidatus Methanoperedens sp.]|nr:tRNA (pseudouridine(54)-N(1))-methyltransferase TrmY [Candidatus Methanoperedens sp.]MCE8429057.1 tRNA (pseudouridine(54)-N(1))-methyltransferase TrmY [Candidatus Methanoperedens sp.]
MKEIVIIGHKAATAPFSLNDLPGAAGRMDILCRCVSSALFLSHDLRRDVRVHIILKGPPDEPKAIRFDGSSIRYLSPDERSSASLIKKALEKNVRNFWMESTPGVSIRKGDFGNILHEINKKVIYLCEGGEDIRGKRLAGTFDDTVFVLGDHLGLTGDEEKTIEEYEHEIVSIGPLSLHADHCIVLLLNELDRKEYLNRNVQSGEDDYS